MAGVLERLGIADTIRSKLTLAETDIVSELVSRGELSARDGGHHTRSSRLRALHSQDRCLRNSVLHHVHRRQQCNSQSIDAAKELMEVLKSLTAIGVIGSQGIEPGK